MKCYSFQRLYVALLLLSVLILTGCVAREDTLGQELQPLTNATWIAGDSPVPQLWTGLRQQGVTMASKRVDSSSNGIYYINKGDDYILYCDHDSDTFVPLCSRADCAHADYEGRFYYTCDAYFSGAESICFYNGYLYVLMYDELDYGFPSIKRVNADGTDRITIWKHNAEEVLTGATLWNGVLTYSISYLDEDGNVLEDDYYFKLDGSMKEPQLTEMGYPRGNDGEAFITNANGVWDPETAEERFLTEFVGIGYYGTEAAYVVMDGVITKVTYETGEYEAMLDTGLTGTYDLSCFPDCLVLKETLPYEQLAAGERLKTQHLYFYNWAFDFLGSIEIERTDDMWTSNLICGETANRIYLALEHSDLPSQYIDKSDFATGNITFHEITLPQQPFLETGVLPPRELL